MESIAVVNFGVAAVLVQFDTVRIFLDAFNSITDAPELRHGDILLFTHDDNDHFDVNKIPCLKEQEITIIGPPSIVKPLLESEKATINQIQTVYSPNNQKPSFIEVAGIRVTAYRTPHFLDWKPVHNSYALHHNQHSVYITGDSYLTREMKDDIGDVDFVICNLVDEGYITGTEDPRFAAHHLMSYLLSIIAAYSPQKIVGVHLIDFDGTINPKEMKKLTEDYHFNEIIIPAEKGERITL